MAFSFNFQVFCVLLPLVRFGISSSCDERSTCEDSVVMLQQGRPTATFWSHDTLTEDAVKTHRATDSMTKAQVEIVLSHYDENTDWSNDYAHLRTIYCKGAHRPLGCIPQKNVGREGYTYLQHIVSRYDSLAEWTIFSHAQEPTVGYKRGSGGHMMPGYTFEDYLTDKTYDTRKDGADFVFTGALDIASFDHYMRSHYVQSARSPSWPTRCPSEDTDGWTSWPFGKFETMLAAKCNIAPADLPSHFMAYWANLEIEQPPVIFFAQGARFAASRERIRQRPKAFYEKMLRFVSESADPCENYFNEWMWYYMIGLPQEPCEWKRDDARDGKGSVY